MKFLDRLLGEIVHHKEWIIGMLAVTCLERWFVRSNELSQSIVATGWVLLATWIFLQAMYQWYYLDTKDHHG